MLTQREKLKFQKIILGDKLRMLKTFSAASLSVTNIKAIFCTRIVNARKKNLQASWIGGVRESV